ncbi:hypothetical protein NO135_26160, partial [Clostridioides difficile]|nr:hypothetical protein [Clostridioides difficile]
NAFHAGLATASLGVLALVFSILVGLHAHRFAARVLATFGFLVFAAVLAWDAQFTLKMTFAQIAAPGLIQG